MLDYRKMTQNELVSCALLASQAFYGYEYFSIFVPDDKRRERFLDALIKCEFRANANSAETRFVTARENGRIVAVAQLCTPDFKRASDLDYIRSGYLSAVLRGGIRAVNAWVDMDRAASAPCHELAGNNWYLSLLTVAKSVEGHGIGSRFLNEYLIPYVKNAGGETLSLFTNSDINRRFYEKNGFNLFDERRFGYGGRSMGSWSYSMKL